MSELMQGVLIAFIPGLLISVATAYITVKLSLRQFYSQRWWERKADAYSQIVEQLYGVERYYDRLMSDYMSLEGVLSEEARERLNRDFSKAANSIRKIRVIGAYVVSDETINALNELMKHQDVDPDADWFGYLNSEHIAVTKCISKIREHGKKDLQVR